MAATFDVYCRVSQVQGRKGKESYESPEVQEAEARAWIKSRKHRLGVVVVEEDVSGGKAAKDRKLETLLVRCEQGKSRGIVTLNFSRFSREDPYAALATVNRLHEAGATLIGVGDNIDTSSENGFITAAVMADQSHKFREAKVAEWARINARRAARKAHGGPLVPAGYDRDENGRLHPNRDAEAIRQAFLARARGTSYRSIALELKAAGAKVRAHSGEHCDWTESTVRQVLANRVYLGEAKIPGHVTRGAHDPIVTAQEWKDAQSKRAPARGKSEGGLLSGLLVCRTCGGKLTYEGNRYRCRQRSRGLSCEAPAVISAQTVEDYITGIFHEENARMGVKLKSPDEDLSVFERAVQMAQDELDGFLSVLRLADMPEAEAAAQIRARRDAVADAEAELETARAESKRATLPKITMAEWLTRLTPAERRRFLGEYFLVPGDGAGEFVSGVTVTPGRGSVEQRVEVLEP